MSETPKVLPEETLTKLETVIAGQGHVYLPEAIVAELLRGYRRYVAITTRRRPAPTRDA